MKRFLTMLLVISLLSLCLPLLASCNEGGDTVTLYVYNWGEYMSDGSEGSLDVNAAFEEYCKEKGTALLFPPLPTMWTEIWYMPSRYMLTDSPVICWWASAPPAMPKMLPPP